MKCYCISGLGADHRAFKYLDFGMELVHIKWIDPEPKESLTNYSFRLSEQIDTTEPFMLLGMSFGGIIANHISSFTNPQQTIIISSLLSRDHLPRIYKFVGNMGIYKLIPPFLLKPPMWLAYWLFSVKTQEDKKLLKAIIKDTDTRFLKWAIDKILTIKQIPSPKNRLVLHGTKDRLLPLRDDANIHHIKGGGHFMIIQRAEEINDILRKKLN